MIRFDQVHKRYPNGREALAGVSFNIESGAFAQHRGARAQAGSRGPILMKLRTQPTKGMPVRAARPQHSKATRGPRTTE